MALEASGLRVDDVLDAAAAKDGGCTPATLAWLVGQLPLPEGPLPGDVDREALERYRDELVRRLRKLALP